MMKSIAVIPARLGSTRLPGKVLADINGKPMIWHVWSRVVKAKHVDFVCVATDSEDVVSVVQSWGGAAYLTSSDCASGTDRISSIIEKLDAELILNVQGDEPMVDPLMLDELILFWEKTKAEVVTPVFSINSYAELTNPNIVKVVRAADKKALYFSRQPIPFHRDLPIEKWVDAFQYWGHVGVYAYRRDVLTMYSRIPESKLEAVEKLEQLKFLEAGVDIFTIETSYRPLAVDTMEDLTRIRAFLKTSM